MAYGVYSQADGVSPYLKVTLTNSQYQVTGYGGVYMANLFAFVHTDRFEMMKAADPIGADNDRHLLQLIDGAGLIVAAWGNEGRHLKRSTAVRQLLPASTMCFVLNATGEPRHPLYMKNDSVLIPLS
ncbi:DUF1643 domain-containing protein [Salmonella enterica subsp. enterica]|uniref:DUF1643 domain-containing protein n=1 Tax=Salmonella enterica I TaxID=59201 RepID=A0A3U8YMH5_SALET|nr:hypothetical protein [Salmonella enterica subsp. enterica]EAM1318394.1 DUF1643 domain-containing protein [Salmonella enterica]ECA3804747.1 DUF1643 domain-containing protein [Salmonella enterica subsp. enterica serovar Agona]ECD7684503.1 DUF1643 domain-containing protein [Salmonella enterica subsp. enterica serovar Typhimurium]EDQ0782081.1 DUF1643 domain-containing protein [Salmonella enterica subsp. enterica serovar 4,[5],12:i:-]EFD4009182.1 DUF1643 domain-containing protein [Escherichia co